MTNATQTSPELQSRPTKVGPSRRRHVVNRGLLLATLAGLVVAMPSAYFWYKYQLSKTADAMLLRAEQLEQEEDWTKATSYYQRYLLVRPDDTTTLVRMVEAYAKGEPTPRRVSRLTRLLYQTLGRAPERNDLRLMLAESLLKLGDHEEAEREAQKLAGAPAGEGPAARRVIALSKFVRSRGSDSKSIAIAIKALIAVAEELPDDVQLVMVTVEALRQHPMAVELEGKEPATYADEMMDKLVASDPENVDALIARYQYRVRYKLADQDRDLQSALEISPDHIEVLLLSARAAFARDDQDGQTKTLLHRAIDAAPGDPRAYVTLAKMLSQAGDASEAVKLLRQGRSQTENHLGIDLVLSGELITAGDLDDAAQSIRDVESQSAELFVRMNAAGRTQLENQLRLLRAKLELARGGPTKAVPDLQAILLATEAIPTARHSAEWIQAITMLAQITSNIGQWDKAASYWEELARVFPRNPNVIQSTAAAYLNAGDATHAVKRLDDYSRLADLTTDMRVQLTQAHLALQLSRPASDRSWSEFLTALSSAKSKNKDRRELVFAEVNYLLSDLQDKKTATRRTAGETASESRRRAAKILQVAEESFEEQAAFWRGAALAYRRLDRETDVERAVDRYLQTETSPVNRATLQVSLLSDVGNFDEVEELLKKIRTSLSGDQRRQIDRLRIENRVAAKQLPEAHQLASELIEADPTDAKLLAMGIEISLGLGDFQTAEKWETTLGSRQSNKYEWRYLRSLRQLGSYDQLDRAEKEELARSILSIRSQRPRWYPVVSLAARHAQIRGDTSQSLSDYRLAIDLGDRRSQTLEQLVSLLYQQDRFSEAEKYLGLISGDSSESPVRDSLAIKLAIKQDHLADALELAKQGVARYPLEAMRHIWLSNLMLRNQQPQEAIEVLRQAAQRFPDDSRVWKGLFTLFAKTGRSEDARTTLAAFLAKESIPEGSRHFVAAQGFEILGDLEKAKQHYELALVKQPKEIAIRLRYAKLLLASDTLSARDQYEHVLLLAPNDDQARRELAGLLAATGRDEDWHRAQQLLERQTEDSQANTATNDRLRAVLLSRQGRTRNQRLANCHSARKILQRLIQAGGDNSADINRRLLASVYEQEATLGKDLSLLFAAREQMRYLVDREHPSPQNLTLYIEFLVRHATSESTTLMVEEGETASDELREVFLADAESRLRDLKKVQLDDDIAMSETLSSVDLTVRLLQAQGQNEEAAEYVAEWVRSHDYEGPNENAKAQLYLMTGKLYSKLGQHAEAERWYRRLMTIAPRAYVMVVQTLVDQNKHKEAAQLCLNVADGEPDPEEAILLARIMMSADQAAEPLSAARLAIEAAVEKHADNLDLLQAEAVMKASLGEYDQAIASFRRMIEIDSKNALAMNNLATLLADRSNQRAEALEYIDRAINIAGRMPALLDTQGTIFLKMGDSDQAISCLEEATAAGATDARYYFHLAAAYKLADRIEEANSSLQTARDYGIEKSVLTNDDRSLLTRLGQQLAKETLESTGVN